MNRRPGHYARDTRLAATIAFTITTISALAVALTGAPDTLLRANLAILIGFALLLLAAACTEKALTRNRDTGPQIPLDEPPLWHRVLAGLLAGLLGVRDQPTRTDEPRAYRHHDHNHDNQ